MPKCKSCQKEIVWIKMDSSKAMPCDPERMAVVTDEGKMVRGRVPHWGTCPNANEFRK